MPDGWPPDDSLLSKFREVAAQLHITIYGPLQPDSERLLLEGQRNALRKAGYPETKLALEYPVPNTGTTPLQVSKGCLEKSDANFLILTKNGKNQETTREIEYIFKSPTMADKAAHCVIFDEVSGDYRTASSLSVGRVENSGIRRCEFSGESELNTRLESCAFLLAREQYGELQSRL